MIFAWKEKDVRGRSARKNLKEWDTAYLFICMGVYRQLFLIVVGSEEFTVVSRVLRRECKMTIWTICLLFVAGGLALVH